MRDFKSVTGVGPEVETYVDVLDQAVASISSLLDGEHKSLLTCPDRRRVLQAVVVLLRCSNGWTPVHPSVQPVLEQAVKDIASTLDGHGGVVSWPTFPQGEK